MPIFQRIHAGTSFFFFIKKVLFLLTVLSQTTKRTGWVNHHVRLPESISDHMYRMGILSFLVDDEKIDKTRAMKVRVRRGGGRARMRTNKEREWKDI